jgi:hypothetical protein
MVTLARNLYFFRSRFLTGLTAVFVVRRRYAPAWQVCTLALCSCHHRKFSFSRFLLFETFGLKALRRNDGPASTLWARFLLLYSPPTFSALPIHF